MTNSALTLVQLLMFLCAHPSRLRPELHAHICTVAGSAGYLRKMVQVPGGCQPVVALPTLSAVSPLVVVATALMACLLLHCTVLSAVYRNTLPEGAAVLELCASRYSHLPEGLKLCSMIGQGMNEQELAANTELTEWFVQVSCCKGQCSTLQGASYTAAVATYYLEAYSLSAPAPVPHLGYV